MEISFTINRSRCLNGFFSSHWLQIESCNGRNHFEYWKKSHPSFPFFSDIRQRKWLEIHTYCRFIEEQGFINEFDDIDHSAVHLCAYLNDTAVGCLRFFPERNDASVWHLGRVAVLPHYRHQKIATALLTQAEQTIRQKGAQRIRLDAQKAVCSLYAQAGYQICGTPFYDEHMEHIPMQKFISKGNLWSVR